MATSVHFSAWEIIREGNKKELGRSYRFSGLGGERPERTVDVRVRLVESNTIGNKLASLFGRQQKQPFVYFVIEPYIFEQNGWAIAQFGLEREGRVNHKFFQVRIEATARGVNFILVDEEHSKLCLDALMQCDRLVLSFLSNAGEQLGSLPLENDLQFISAFHLLKIDV
jgi:hypothetical protein